MALGGRNALQCSEGTLPSPGRVSYGVWQHDLWNRDVLRERKKTHRVSLGQ